MQNAGDLVASTFSDHYPPGSTAKFFDTAIATSIQTLADHFVASKGSPCAYASPASQLLTPGSLAAKLKKVAEETRMFEILSWFNFWSALVVASTAFFIDKVPRIVLELAMSLTGLAAVSSSVPQARC